MLRYRTVKIHLKALIIATLSIIIVFFFQNCGVERPRVEDLSYASTTVTPSNHQNFASTTQCGTCHEGARPLNRTLSHNFSHIDSNWSNQDCSICHYQKETWGITWSGGQFAHSPIPGRCIECHIGAMPTYQLNIANDLSRPFKHSAGVECATCHINTSRFDMISDWRPASAQPNGLVGTKSFPVNVIDVSFSGTTMIRSTPKTQNFKLEIDHNHELVANLSCSTCHNNTSTTIGNYSEALFHANISTNPTTCLECHSNALPTGAVGSKGLMRHDAVDWITNSIGTVSRGSTSIVNSECMLCHYISSSMPQAGVPPISGSKPFTDASYHLNTSLTAFNSCLDCHAHSRPTGSASFNNLTWKDKTNIGTTLDTNFTTFDLTTHASKRDCSTCHIAPTTASSSSVNWANGYFLHSSTTSNCLSCHTAAGVTSTNHTGLNSNCTTCHLGSISQFPNPIVADWKVNVSGLTPTGVVGESTIINSVICNQVLGSTPSCVASNPNIIPKGYDHAINSNAVSCQNCHGTSITSYANGKFHTAPSGLSVPWIPPAATDLNNCNACHDPTTMPLNVVSIRSLGIVGSQINVSTGSTPYDGVNHNHSLVVGKQCSQCHTTPTTTSTSNWIQATKVHTKFSPTLITTCLDCHLKRMPAGLKDRVNQVTYKGTSRNQKFTHTNATSIPTLSQQECSTCHTNDGVSWTTAGKISFHNKITTTKNCNLCHVAPGGVVTSSTTGISYNHDLVTSLGDCVTCHSASVSKVSGRIPAASDWDGGTGAPANYTIPSHVTGGFTVPGYTGKHTSNTNCTSCHSTGNYKVITNFDHQGLPSNENSCVSCHLGSKSEVSAYIATASNLKLSSDASSRHHPTAKFKGGTLSCVGCHTLAAGTTTFNNSNGIVYPLSASSGYVNVGCGSVNGTTYSCHQSNQRIMTVPINPTGTGVWKK